MFIPRHNRPATRAGFASALLIAATLIVSAGSAGVASAQVPQLGTPVDIPDVPNLPPAVIRTRTLIINPETIGAVAQGSTMIFNLFDDATVQAVFDRRKQYGDDWYTWSGRLTDVENGKFILSYCRGAVHIDLSFGTSVYEIRTIPGAPQGCFAVRQIQLGGHGRCGSAIPGVVEPPPQPPADGGNAGGGGDEVPQDDSSRFDIMVVWTLAAENGAGGQNGILSAIGAAVTDLNTTLSNSGVGTQARLVLGYQIDYQESGDAYVDLPRLANTSDGFMDSVHANRDAYGIDLVSLITESGQSTLCGLGYTPGASGLDAVSGFTWVRRECLGGLNAGSFAHEIGHNFGCRHDRANDDGAPPLYYYGYGYRFGGILYRTTMAYEPGIRVQYFSTPNRTFGGFAVGTPTEHNALAIANSAPGIANYRQYVQRIYLAWFGNNNGDGTPLYPFASLGNAQNNTPAGWTISISGEFRVSENLTINRPCTLDVRDINFPATIGTP